MDTKPDTVLRRCLQTPAAAVYTGKSESFLEKLRVYGGGPRYRKIGRSVVYAIEDLDAWLDSKCRTSTSDESIAEVA